jgi:DNA/RNA-binding domain of Phe-tRNA-synthetase-like protein
MRRRETLVRITDRIGIYARFFESFGFECPLPKHLKRTVNSGFPRYNLMVDAHFMSEMCAGILVAVSDYNYFDRKLTLDLAEEGEICVGMGQRDLKTREGEIVFRDEEGIVCVLCQGADEKTRVRDNTRDVLFYAYAVPEIEARYIKEGRPWLNLEGER